MAKRVSEVWFLKIHNVLQHVVTKGVLDEMKSVVRDVLYELGFLLSRSMIDAALEDATAMTMSPNYDTICADSIEDEL